MESTDRKNSEFGDSTTVLIRDGDIVEDLRRTVGANLLHDSPLPASCCIFRVPEPIRRQKTHAYEPDIISIGPFHRGKGEKFAKFQLMDKVKRWYLQCLLTRTKTNLESLIKRMVELDSDKRARECYAEPLDHLDKSDFIEMLILDGCFLVELFHRKKNKDFFYHQDDPIFNVACVLGYLWHDLLLLENQLPWLVLESLYNQTENKNSTGQSNNGSLVPLVLNFFKQSEADELNFNSDRRNSDGIMHILDLIRTVMVDPFKEQQEQQVDRQEKKTAKLPQRIPNATTLLDAGVSFKQSTKTPHCIMNTEFKSGVFTIPQLTIDERTGPLFRNLIAFEQCYHLCLHKITSYAVLMDNLIDSSKDINLLCEKGILANWLSAEDACQFFNELYNDTTVIGFYYEGLFTNVNEHYNKPWNKWIEKLRSDYFSTPWAIISLTAAFILLVLTFLQTVYTIQQYYHPPS